MIKLILQSDGIVGGGVELSPAQLPVVLGRSHRADITINDALLSRMHSEIRYRQNEGFEIADLDSTNLTIVNEQHVVTQVLASGDIILLGDTPIVVTISEPIVDPEEQTTRDLPMIPGDDSAG